MKIDVFQTSFDLYSNEWDNKKYITFFCTVELNKNQNPADEETMILMGQEIALKATQEIAKNFPV